MNIWDHWWWLLVAARLSDFTKHQQTQSLNIVSLLVLHLYQRDKHRIVFLVQPCVLNLLFAKQWKLLRNVKKMWAPRSCSSLLSTAVVNTMTKSDCGGKNWFALTTLRSFPVFEGSQGENSSRSETQMQELKQRPWRNTTYWLASPCLSQPSFLIQPRIAFSKQHYPPLTKTCLQTNLMKVSS